MFPKHSLPGTKVPGNSREYKFPGTFIFGSESSQWGIIITIIPFWDPTFAVLYIGPDAMIAQ